MCLLVLAWRAHPRYSLVLAGNRDEFHARPAAAAAWWSAPTGLLAGRDLEAGGTWLGLTRSGRFAVITNFREAVAPDQGGRPSRGALIPAFAAADSTPAEYVAALDTASADYAGFNLVLGDINGLFYSSNRDVGTRKLAPGIYGLANETLDSPAPKLTQARKTFEAVLAAPKIERARLFALLADPAIPAGATPRENARDPALERALLAPFVNHRLFGTRCSTVITVSTEGRASFTERSFDAEGNPSGLADFQFDIQPAH